MALAGVTTADVVPPVMPNQITCAEVEQFCRNGNCESDQNKLRDEALYEKACAAFGEILRLYPAEAKGEGYKIEDTVVFGRPEGEARRLVDFRNIEASYWTYPLLIQAAIESTPEAVELYLPYPLDSKCSTRSGARPSLSNIRVKHPLKVVLPSLSLSDGERRPICEDSDKVAPFLLVESLTFESPVTFVMPEDGLLSLAFTAVSFESTLQIFGTRNSWHSTKMLFCGERNPKRKILPGPSLTINTSSFGSDTYLYNLTLCRLNIYFNRLQSLGIHGISAQKSLVVEDNDIGPLRFRWSTLPKEFKVDANRVRDSFYITEAFLRASLKNKNHNGTLPSVIHNRIDGNLELGFSVLNTSEMADRVAQFRAANNEVGGSAYVNVSVPTRFSDPICLDVVPRSLKGTDVYGSTLIEFTDSIVSRRLIVSRAGFTPVYAGSSYCKMVPLTPNHVESSISSCDIAPQSADTLQFDLTGTRTDVFAWNLPHCADPGIRKFTWIGDRFDFNRFETASLGGESLNPVGSQQIENSTDRLLAWARLRSGLSGGEVYTRLESYLLSRGDVFGAWAMKGDKVRALLWETARHSVHNIGEKLTFTWTYLNMDSQSAVAKEFDEAEMPQIGIDKQNLGALPKAIAYETLDGLLNLFRLVLVVLVGIWGLPAGYGEHPQVALALLLATVLIFGLMYRKYSLYCNSIEWKPNDEHWSKLSGRQHDHGWYSKVPGFLQRDQTTWRKMNFFWFSIDCTLPLIELEYRKEYRPLSDGTRFGELVAHLPSVQLIIGIWFGTWAVAIFFV
jgi:hypothetical protein